MIPKTLYEIYLAALVRGNGLKLSRDGTKIYEYRGPLSFLQSLMILKPKAINTYIITPTDTKMKGAIPNKDKAYFHKQFGVIPKCKWLDCGRNIEYGYEYCDNHRRLCCRCNKRETQIHINCESLCYDCLRPY